MPRISPTRVRFSLVAMFTLLALGLLQPRGYSQPGRPPGFPPVGPPGLPGRPPGGGITGIPGGGIPGRPPGGIGGMPGTPGGGFSGIPGNGITGRPPGGISGIPGGGIAGMPGGFSGIPGGIGGNPGGFSGIPGGGIPSMPGPGGIGGGIGGTSQQKWTCGKCKGVLGYGPNDPGQTTCPHCGVRLTGANYGPGTGPGMPNMTPPTMPGAGIPTAGATPPGGLVLPTNPAFGGGSGSATPGPNTSLPPTTAPPAVVPSDPPSSGGSSTENSTSSGSSRVWKRVGIAVGSIILLGVIGMLAAVVKNSSGGKPVKRARRRVVRDYDDE